MGRIKYVPGLNQFEPIGTFGGITCRQCRKPGSLASSDSASLLCLVSWPGGWGGEDELLDNSTFAWSFGIFWKFYQIVIHSLMKTSKRIYVEGGIVHCFITHIQGPAQENTRVVQLLNDSVQDLEAVEQQAQRWGL